MTVTYQDHMGDDSAIIQAMLVSTDDALLIEEMLEEKTTFGRINFLMKNRHGTPFEHAALKFYVEAPIFVFREWHRHRIAWSYNEQSGRYRELPPIFYIPARSRPLVQVGKAGAYEFVAAPEDVYDRMVTRKKDGYEHSYQIYLDELADGVCREIARTNLPVGIYSAMFTTCNPRSMMAFLSLRTKDLKSLFPSFPQKEIEMCAQIMEESFAETFPLCHRAFQENGRVAP